jgi:hypothetical protein
MRGVIPHQRQNVYTVLLHLDPDCSPLSAWGIVSEASDLSRPGTLAEPQSWQKTSGLSSFEPQPNLSSFPYNALDHLSAFRKRLSNVIIAPFSVQEHTQLSTIVMLSTSITSAPPPRPDIRGAVGRKRTIEALGKGETSATKRYAAPANWEITASRLRAIWELLAPPAVSLPDSFPGYHCVSRMLTFAGCDLHYSEAWRQTPADLSFLIRGRGGGDPQAESRR